VHCARFACKKMKWETKTRGRELPGMEALSFTVLVPHSGVGVAAVGCVEDVDSPSSLLCFAMLSSSFVFCSPCQRCSYLSAVASCRCCWWQGRERLAVVRRGRCFGFSVFTSSSSCLLIVVRSLSSLFIS
jgi:hypothetical protein